MAVRAISYSEACAVVPTIVLWEHTRFIENTKDTSKFKGWNQVTETLQAQVSPASSSAHCTRASDDILHKNTQSEHLDYRTVTSEVYTNQLNST